METTEIQNPQTLFWLFVPEPDSRSHCLSCPHPLRMTCRIERRTIARPTVHCYENTLREDSGEVEHLSRSIAGVEGIVIEFCGYIIASVANGGHICLILL